MQMTGASLRSNAGVAWLRSARKFYFESLPLSPAQEQLLERKQFAALTRRTLFWFATLMFAALVTVLEGDKVQKPALLFAQVPWTLETWSITLLASMLPYAFLLPRLMNEPAAGNERSVSYLHVIWIAWLTLVAFVFISGNWALEWQPPSSTRFHLAQQTFVYLTIVGQVFTVLFLSTSRKATLTVIGIGILAPFYPYIAPQLAANPVGPKIPWVNLHIFFGGQLAVYLLIGWFLPAATGLRREILLEEEHRRADAERARANRFIVTIGHDLKQPLTAMTLRLATLAKRAARDSEMSSLAREIQGQASALGEMIQASFDLSRLHSGTWEVSPREVALPNLIHRVLDEFYPVAAERGVLLEAQHVPDYVVWTDPDALGRILRNLLANAIKYTPAERPNGPGRIVVEFVDRSEAIQINVADNGIGIPSGRKDDVFNEYIQLDNPERDRSKGFGLGLSIVRGLTQLLGHDLSLSSTEGSGSRFSITIPIKARIPVELLETKKAPAAAPRLKNAVIFLVEDDPAQREALVEHLLDWGCYVVDGGGPTEVIEKLRTDDLPGNRTEFILSDYRLRAGMNGLKAIADIRAELGNKNTPAAIWTGESGADVLQAVSNANIQLLTKPVSLEELATLIQSTTGNVQPITSP
jgi:signal transduction histidine kinase/CheY-like chemotaxis protein